MKNNEEWRPVDGFPGYEVSDAGRMRGKRGTLLSPGGRRYAQVCLQRDGVQVSRSVHGLVAAAFLGPCPAGHEVNHKNLDKRDNRLSNLEYVTHGHNMIHAWLSGVRWGGSQPRTTTETR